MGADGLVLDVEAWARVLTGLYGPVSTRVDPGEGFRAAVRVRELGAVRVSAVRCPPVEVVADAVPCDERGARHHLALVLDGELVLDQAGRTTRVGRGDLVLFDTGCPFRLRPTAPWNAVVTAHLAPTPPTPSAPLSLPPQSPGGPGRLTARELPGREGLAALVAGFLAGLARDATPYRPCEELRLGTVVTDLVGALRDQWLGEEDPEPPVLLPRIQAYVLRHLGDGGLTPDRVAAAHHISTRYLHRLFQRQGLTVAAWIKAQRLERCRRDLADPHLRRLPVYAIGARWGFANAADFSRAFRTAYGITPTCFREGEGGGGGEGRGVPAVRVRSLPRNSARSANDRHATPQQTHR
ncbi:helix-turn-helix domain-containing protein [Streptomyces sp. NBC_00038]|uniref:helix-turn-helix domain-containing protein n=1 Tax=Streptomyces sp. NBC_00038 TaxID=2903615 RepID=UPI002255B9A9|nr:helix-turn-helix domain-containing protein [Streptomyces sp. NBC_00038]MCX5559379.1 helix-turn-helix domain-containing protein [Streptomyces sp. NBC_00038]